jgi:hydroxyethylthiazole kinase
MNGFVSIAQAIADVHAENPLVGSWTNFVTINLVANAQLAVGGRAAMCFMPDEAYSLASISRAIYINVGTLQPVASEALPRAAQAAARLNKPWVLDPVAAGLGDSRTAVLKALKLSKPTVIRGNASEIITLSNLWDLYTESKGNVEGVDATQSVEDAMFAARKLAEWTGGAVAVSGEVDLVLNLKEAFRIRGGSPLLKKITGAGCSLGGLIAVYASVTDPLTAALTGSVIYKWASRAAEQAHKGSASFQTAFLDNLSLLNTKTIQEYAEWAIIGAAL